MSGRRIAREEVAPLLKGLPFGGRIEHLMGHPELGRSFIGTHFGQSIYPNCMGTALHVLEAESVFLQHLDYHEEDFHVRSRGSLIADFFMFPKKFNSPGAVESKPMMEFLNRGCKRVSDLIPGCLIVTGGLDISRNYRKPFHIAVYLGSDGNREYIFEQPDTGEKFGFSSVKGLRRKADLRDVEFYMINGRA